MNVFMILVAIATECDNDDNAGCYMQSRHEWNPRVSPTRDSLASIAANLYNYVEWIWLHAWLLLNVRYL